MRNKIQRLREEFEKVVNGNNSLHEEIRLTSDELIVDDAYLNIIRKEKDERLTDIKHKYDWLKANVQATISKVNKFFVDSVKTPKIYVFGLKSKEYVTTLRSPNLPSNFVDEMLNINGEIDDFERKIDFHSLERVYKSYIINNESNRDNQDDYIESILNRIETRLAISSEDKEREHREQSTGVVSLTTNKETKRADNSKNWIKEELDITNEDLREMKKILEDKKGIKEKTLKKYLEIRDKFKKKFSTRTSIALGNNKALKCPESYSLKISYDKYYTEQSMKTALLHRKKMFDFLNYLAENREEFNKKVIELRKKKEELIAILKEKKLKLSEINQQLGIESDSEKLDWLDYHMNDKYEYPEREFNVTHDEIEKYMADKINLSNDKELISAFANMKEGENLTYRSHRGEDEVNTGMIVDPKKEHEQQSSNGGLVLQYRDRGSKKTYENNIESELRSINQLKFDNQKRKLVNECKKLIDDFDKEVNELKNLKITTFFKQKLGELELLIQHEEDSILRAFESEDSMLIKKLEDLCNDYRDNLNNLKNCHEGIVQNEEELGRATADKQQKEKEFYALIANEKESREQLIKCFKQRKKAEISKDNPQDDKIDNDDELDLPRNISNQLKQDILTLRDSREHYDQTIEKLTKNINNSKKQKNNLIQTKLNLDRRRDEIRDKINVNERKKSKYLNLIDLSIPLKLDQFCKMEATPVEGLGQLEIYKLPLDISKAILISKTKLKNLENLLITMKEENKQFEDANTKFNYEYDDMEREKKDLDKKLKELDTNFKNEQILKFGLVIDFDFLLKASKDTTVDKLETEYKGLK